MKNFLLLLFMSTVLLASAQIDEQGIDGTKQFGNAVATDGNWAVVGNMWQTGQLNGNDYTNAGMVSIYKILPNGNWEHRHNINEPAYFAYDNNPGAPAGLYFGCSVDISGDHIIVGAYAYDSDMQGNIGPDGMAFIYSYDANLDLFVKSATLAPEVAVVNEFGWSVAISDNWAVVGDPSDQHPLPAGGDDRENIGSAHIYKLEAGNWIYHKKLEASNGWGSEQGLAVGPGDNFGYSVDVDGNRIIVGALKQGVEINQPRGAAYIYEWQGGVNWSESFLQADDIVNYSEFGKKVAIYGDYALIGSPRHDNGNGTAYLFHKNGANWGAGTQISVDGVVSGGYFGSAVSLNDEFLAIGDYGLNNASGKVYLYDYKNAFQKTELLSSNIAIGDEYGIDCDLSEEHFIVGAEKTERNGNLPGREGTAYIYSMALAFGGNWTGAADTDWGNPDNWADFNVPNGATNVVIGAAAANQPFIDKMQANCKHLTIEAGATLSFGADGFLQANGDVNNAGQIAESAKSKDANPRIIVLGETLFNGAGRQDIPSGLYQDFTFQAQGDSYITGDVTFNGDYDHDTFDDLIIGANTLTIGGFISGQDNRMRFSSESSLTIINDRVIDLNLSSGIYDLYDLTINVPGNHHVAIDGSIEVHNQLNLLDGNLYLGHDNSGGGLELHNPIHIVDGQLMPHKWGGTSDLHIYNANKSKSVFHIPSSLSTLNMLFIERSGATVLDGNLHIEFLFYLGSDGFSANGHQITYDENASIWVSGNAEISADMISGPNGIQNIKIFTGSPTLNFDGEIKGDLEIVAAVGQVEIAAGRSISVSGTTTVGAPLVIRSDATGTACFLDKGPISYGGEEDAQISVERYIPSKDEWHYVSTPVQNSTARFFAGSYLNAYDTDNSLWVSFTSLDQAVNTMQGYSSKIPNAEPSQTYTFSGQLNTARMAPLSINLSNGGDKYNLVGNPFPSVIDWDHASWTKANIADAVYIWNASTGSYASYVNGAGVNGGSRYIAPMQGFFVQATGANPSLQIDDNDVRVYEAASFLKDDEEFLNQLSIVLEGATGTDEIMIRFIAEASSGFDEAYDAHKMFGNLELAQVFAIDDQELPMAIHTLSTVKETEFVKLGLKISETGNHTLLFNDHESFIENIFLTLEDKKTQSFVDLNTQDYYEFSYEEGENADRFILHFKDVTSISEITDLEFFAYTIGHSIYVNIEEDVESIQVYNLSGQMIYDRSSPLQGTYKLDLPELAKGFYVLNLQNKRVNRTQKIIIN